MMSYYLRLCITGALMLYFWCNRRNFSTLQCESFEIIPSFFTPAQGLKICWVVVWCRMLVCCRVWPGLQLCCDSGRSRLQHHHYQLCFLSVCMYYFLSFFQPTLPAHIWPHLIDVLMLIRDLKDIQLPVSVYSPQTSFLCCPLVDRLFMETGYHNYSY